MCQISQTILHGRDAILRVRDKWLIFNIIPQLWADVKYHVPTGFGFSPKASGFYPWGNVVSPPKRVAEGLCGWWHGNSFPMTQSAQSHRQMRSIPFCSKAVFYVFCFRAPSIYPLNRKNGRHFRLGEMPPLFVLNPDFGDCQLVGVLVILPPLLLCR